MKFVLWAWLLSNSYFLLGTTSTDLGMLYEYSIQDDAGAITGSSFIFYYELQTEGKPLKLRVIKNYDVDNVLLFEDSLYYDEQLNLVSHQQDDPQGSSFVVSLDHSKLSIAHTALNEESSNYELTIDNLVYFDLLPLYVGANITKIIEAPQTKLQAFSTQVYLKSHQLITEIPLKVDQVSDKELEIAGQVEKLKLIKIGIDSKFLRSLISNEENNYVLGYRLKPKKELVYFEIGNKKYILRSIKVLNEKQ